MTDYRGIALALATLAFALCFALWGMVAPLAPYFRELFNLTTTEVGVLVATPVLLGSLARIPMGLITDRYGGRLVFTCLMLFLLVPALVIGFASSYFALLFWGFWLGVAGSSFAVGVPYVARWYPPQRQGFALGIYGMGNIGTAIANYFGPRIAAAFGWSMAFWVFLPALLMMALLFVLFGREAGPIAQVEPFATRLRVLRRPLVWELALFYFITFGGFVALSIYLPTYLVDVFGISKADAGTRAAIFVLVATAARPLGGLLSDWLGGVWVLSWVFALIASLAVVLAFGPSLPATTAVLFGIALVLGVGNGGVFKLVAERFGGEVGTVTGLVGAGGGIGGFFPPIVMGAVRDLTGSYSIAFALLGALAIVALLLNALLARGQR